MNIIHALQFVTFLFCSPLTFGSNSGQSERDTWQLLRAFLGRWEGEIHGEPGTGKGERSYAFALRERFIQITNKSVYPPQSKNPKGEIHEDIGFFSYDGRAKKFMLRQFHVEGFVDQFALESFDAKERTFVFVTTAIENIAPGWRARETYRFLNDDEFVETFALAEPGKDFVTYSEAHFHRKQP
jgi:hypothetical protein